MGEKAKEGGVNWKAERLRQELRVKRVNAEIKELQRERTLKRYYRAEIVADLQNETFILFRLALGALPGKIAALVAGEDGAAVIANKITDVTREMQEGIARFRYSGVHYLRDRFDELDGKDVFEAAPECFDWEGTGK